MKNVFFFLWLARRDTLYLLFLSWRGTENEVEAKSGIMRKPGLACALAIPRHRFVFEGIKAARLIKDLQKHQYLSIVRAEGKILEITGNV